MKKTDNLHITSVTPLISPADLKKELPLTDEVSAIVADSRKAIQDILTGKDDRVLGIIGPCSIHDTKAALEYAAKLKELKEKVQDKIFIIMRTYFEKPRTTIGWKGLITDPKLDGTYDIAMGVKTARKLLLDITAMGMPCCSELLDPIMPQYIADLICWGSIGARTTESQTHREMASGLSMPVGFKNSTSGDLTIAINAMESAKHSHSFIGIDQDGKTSIFQTAGNPTPHIILRGGASGPNYHEESVEAAEKMMSKLGMEPSIVIDCSHANSGKSFEKQERVLHSIVDQKNRGAKSITGFMLESFLKEGNQKLPADLSKLEYGKSITDQCVSWEVTEKIVSAAAESLKK